MRKDNLTPRQFGLYVEAHPDRLIITATNKMRAGTSVTVQQSYSGSLVETYIVPKDAEVNRRNEALIAEFWTRQFGGKLEPTKKGWWAKDVGTSVVQDFLHRFQTHADMETRRVAAIDYLHAISGKYIKADVLLISVAGSGDDPSKHLLGTQLRASAKKVDNDGWRLAKDRLASRGDEAIGLTEDQVEEARKLAEEYHAKDPKKSEKPSDSHYREVRKKPLLMVHVLGPVGEGKDASPRVPAFGISFPIGDYLKTISVVANKVWIDRMQGPATDGPDQEDDYDE